MAAAKTQSGANAAADVKQRRDAVVSTSPVRIGQKTKAKLGQLVRQANKDRLGRKIKSPIFPFFIPPVFRAILRKNAQLPESAFGNGTLPHRQVVSLPHLP